MCVLCAVLDASRSSLRSLAAASRPQAPFLVLINGVSTPGRAVIDLASNRIIGSINVLCAYWLHMLCVDF